MKYILRRIYRSYSQLLFLLYIKNQKKINIVDIDNTLMDTWPMLADKIPKKDVYRLGRIFPGMQCKVEEMFKRQELVIFLTARNLRFFTETWNWLKSNLPQQSFKLIVVDKPEDKLFFLKKACNTERHVDYFDDLSYNHENGEVKFYDTMIAEVRKIDVNYHDYHEIIGINEEAD